METDKQLSHAHELAEENDEAFMNPNELRALILAKESQNEEKRLDALSVQDRFIWDLSLAVKLCIVEELGPTTMPGVATAQIPIQAVLEAAEAEDPQPSEWTQWIEHKFLQ
jgi:hypothetical protein